MIRPRCYNRPSAAAGAWHPVGRDSSGRFRLRWYARWFTDRCATWEGNGIGPRTGAHPKGEPYPVAHGFDCLGCQHMPLDREQSHQPARDAIEPVAWLRRWADKMMGAQLAVEKL